MPTVKVSLQGNETYSGYYRQQGDYWENSKFLFLRTKLKIDNIGKDYKAFGEFFEGKRIGMTYLPCPHQLLEPQIDDIKMLFDNGFIALINSPDSVDALASKIRPLLTFADNWALVGSDGSCVEGIPGGPVSSFLEGTEKSAGLAIAAFAYVDEDALTMLTTDATRALPEPGRCVFHYADGAVVFYRTRRPARMLAQQLARAGRLSEAWFVVDNGGDDYAGEGGTPLSIRDNRFGWHSTTIENMVTYE